jgi:hypothetical protein
MGMYSDFEVSRIWANATQATQYIVAKVDTTSADFTNFCSAATDVPLGILMNTPKTNDSARVKIAGYGKACYGAAVAAGALISWDTAGKIVAITSGQSATNTIGISVIAGSTGEAGEILIIPAIALLNM